MEIGDRARRWTLREVPTSSLTGRPYLQKRCDALGCESTATEHCSGHGVHFCHRHFEQHREEWHCGTLWSSPIVARC